MISTVRVKGPQLYAGYPAEIFAPKTVNTHTVYLDSLSRATGVSQELKIVTVLNHAGKQLWVVSSGDMKYLTDKYILGEGIFNNLYSSTKLKRVVDYGNKYIKTLVKSVSVA